MGIGATSRPGRPALWCVPPSSAPNGKRNGVRTSGNLLALPASGPGGPFSLFRKTRAGRSAGVNERRGPAERENETGSGRIGQLRPPPPSGAGWLHYYSDLLLFSRAPFPRPLRFQTGGSRGDSSPRQREAT